jgi:hypothetical protein
MYVIDRAGRRVRRICLECKKIHSKKACPLRGRRKRVDLAYAQALKFARWADGYQAWCREQMQKAAGGA